MPITFMRWPSRHVLYFKLSCYECCLASTTRALTRCYSCFDMRTMILFERCQHSQRLLLWRTSHSCLCACVLCCLLCAKTRMHALHVCVQACTARVVITKCTEACVCYVFVYAEILTARMLSQHCGSPQSIACNVHITQLPDGHAVLIAGHFGQCG